MQKDSTHLPFVSILVAARNEETNILRCLMALDQLYYPVDRLEIIIGNDNSEDRTGQIVEEFIANKPQFSYYTIRENIPGLRGKANVLAQLIPKSSGEYLFFCDADIAVAPTWIEHMLALFGENVGVVVGITRMTKTGLFAGLQSLEWILSLATMRFFSQWNIPFTGMGNNMAVTRDAYRKTGGYEKIGFSIVEDYALYIAIIEKGYGFVQGFQSEITSESIPMRSLGELLTQRKRWVEGAMSSPLPIRLSFFVSALFIPLLFVLTQWYPQAAGLITLIHFALVTGISFVGARLLKQYDLYPYLPLFWLYFNLNNTLMLINYLLPTPTTWKGRTYTT